MAKQHNLSLRIKQMTINEFQPALSMQKDFFRPKIKSRFASQHSRPASRKIYDDMSIDGFSLQNSPTLQHKSSKTSKQNRFRYTLKGMKIIYIKSIKGQYCRKRTKSNVLKTLQITLPTSRLQSQNNDSSIYN